MECPRDGTILSNVEILGLELDKCHKCDGIWFDRGELEKIQESAVSDIEEVLEEKYGDPKVETSEPDGYMRCPRCGNRLREQTYTFVNPVRVDRCENCFGFWLDDTELNAIVGEKKELEEAEPRIKGYLRAIFNYTSGSDS
ncbi:MAG: zf-TFIIB domain-containing protein [Planctomycetes bacterium]|nr:zf-TFIIB domain-containing protein [Planctomycetota bacterium]